MSSFAWMELESLSLEISNAEARLADAQTAELVHLARDIETQIANAKARRERLVEAISQNTASLAITPDGEPPAPAQTEDIWPEQSAVPPPAEQAVVPSEAPLAEPGPSTAPTWPVSDPPVAVEPILEPVAEPKEGAASIWEQLAPAHIARVKQELGRRRAAMLARHAEELKALEAEYQEIEAFEQAIEAFARKFSRQPNRGEVVQLDHERDLRLHNNG